MQVIAKEPLRAWVVQGASIILTTIFTCYGIAVYLGHVPAWLPMISDCAVSPPEKYLFRLGIVTGAIFLFIEAKLIYHADKSYTRSTLGLILGSIAALGLSIVGVVNEQENNGIHSSKSYHYNILLFLSLCLLLAAAVIMFLCNIIYMLLFSFFSDAAANTGFISITIKRICAVIGLIAFVTFVFMSILSTFIIIIVTMAMLAQY